MKISRYILKPSILTIIRYMQVLIQPYGKSEISLLQINYKGQQVKMLNISKKKRDNELWSDEQYKEIIHCVQQSKDQKWKFE